MAPKILLLVNSSPSGTGIGELFLREIGGAYPVDRLVRYSTVQAPVGVTSPWMGFRSIERHVPISRWPILSSLAERRFVRRQLAGVVSEIESIIANEGIELVWSVLSSAPTISLADEISRSVDIPHVVTVWDDPNYFMNNQHLDHVTRERTMSSFARVLKSARRVSVIGEAMQMAYRNRYGIDSVVMRHGIENLHVRKWKGPPARADQFRIGFAGSLYAKREWNALVAAIDSCDGRIAGRAICVEFIGRFPKLGARRAESVRCLGSMSFGETLQAISEMDAAYLPYWFGGKQAFASRTSFPGKLSAYAAAGVPVFYHAPKDASAAEFFRRYPFGVCCTSLTSEAIVAALQCLISDQTFLRSAGAARDLAVREELSREVMLSRFSQLIGCEPAALNLSASDGSATGLANGCEEEN